MDLIPLREIDMKIKELATDWVDHFKHPGGMALAQKHLLASQIMEHINSKYNAEYGVKYTYEITEFKKEAIEWVSQFGYSLHSEYTNKYGCELNFKKDNTEDEYYPLINCKFHKNEKSTTIRSHAGFLFINIEASKLEFKHPDTARYIEYIHHYARITKNYPKI